MKQKSAVLAAFVKRLSLSVNASVSENLQFPAKVASHLPDHTLTGRQKSDDWTTNNPIPNPNPAECFSVQVTVAQMTAHPGKPASVATLQENTDYVIAEKPKNRLADISP